MILNVCVFVVFDCSFCVCVLFVFWGVYVMFAFVGFGGCLFSVGVLFGLNVFVVVFWRCVFVCVFLFVCVACIVYVVLV